MTERPERPQPAAGAPPAGTAAGALVATVLALTALLTLAALAPDDVAALMLLGPADTAHPLQGPGAVPAGLDLGGLHVRFAALAGAGWGTSGLGFAFTPGIGPLAVALAAAAGTRVALRGRPRQPTGAVLAGLVVAIVTAAVVTLAASGASLGPLHAEVGEAAARSGLAAVLGALLAAMPATGSLLRAAAVPVGLTAAAVVAVAGAAGEDLAVYAYHLPDAVATTGLLLLGAPFDGGNPLPVGGADRFHLLDPGGSVQAWQATALLLLAAGVWTATAAAAVRLARVAPTWRAAVLAGIAAVAVTVLAFLVGAVTGRLVVGDQRLGADLAAFVAGPLLVVMAMAAVAGVAGRWSALGYAPARPPDPEEPA